MLLYKTKFLSIKSAQREGKSDWVYASRPNAKGVGVILPLINDSEVLFLITKRPPLENEGIAEFCVELPAGLIGDINKKESVEEALERELFEETGLIADEFKINSRRVCSSAGMTDEVSVFATAYISNKDSKNPSISNDDGVILDRIFVQKEDIKDFLKKKEKEGFAISAQALSALYYLFAE